MKTVWASGTGIRKGVLEAAPEGIRSERLHQVMCRASAVDIPELRWIHADAENRCRVGSLLALAQQLPPLR